MSDPEDHTLRLLQEMRAEMRKMHAEMQEGFEGVNLRMDGMTHILVMLAAELHRHDARIEALEDRPGEGGA